MFYIRADGNSAIGMGHVMRCLSIAEASLSRMNIKPVFVIADDGCRDMISERGFDSIVLDTDFRKMETEIPILSGFLKENDMILVDSYQATVNYYKKLNRLCHTSCLEDMGEPYPVDVLINYNIYGPDLKDIYEAKSDIGRRAVRLLLGTDYMPLREAFMTGLEYEVRDKVHDVMVTTGGSDPLYAAGSILEKITKIPDITIHVVSGPFNKNASHLKREYGHARNVKIYENLKELKSLIKTCDVVITATGSTVYEVSAIGVPMVCFYFADNQKQGAMKLEEMTDIVNAGCFADDSIGTADKIYDALLKCIGDYEYRKNIYEQEIRLIDGKGAIRIVEELL